MFNNIGRKIKILAMVIAGLIIVIGSNTGLGYMELKLYRAGFYAIIISIGVAWLSTFMLYGFGEIIDKLTEIAENTKELKLKNNLNIKEDNCDTSVDKIKSDKNINNIEVEKKKDLNISMQNIKKDGGCPICGEKVEEGRAFCIKCGLDIKRRSEMLGWD